MYRTEIHKPMHASAVRAERRAGFACLISFGMPSSIQSTYLHSELHTVLQEQAPDG